MAGQLRAVVATNAFGMGIDKQDNAECLHLHRRRVIVLTAGR